ncbi:MAG: stress response translation initiation inhibitor YciH [Bacteroidetes bacterium]|nr:stress response translation initiation inhibitor YciH [Bacteroidota bacterium]
MSFYPNDGVVRVGRETKGRRGSGVTVISGLPGSEDALKQIASKLKAQCGVGGTVKDRIVEIQGDQRDRLVKILSDAGYTVKKAGG